MIKEKEGVRIYIVDDYVNKAQVVSDLEAQKKVIVISNQDDVLSFYGAILEQYNQYNLYKVDNLEDADDDYIGEIYEVDETKEEAIMYVGKPLVEMVTEVIDSLPLDDKQKRIMGLTKELMKGGNDIKAKAEMDVMVKKIQELQRDNVMLSEEISLYKTKEQKNADNENKISVLTTINLDMERNQNIHIMYIRETERVKYVNTMLVQYQKMLEKIKKKKTKIIIFDETIKWKYHDIININSIEQYKADTIKYKNASVMVVNQVYPIIVTDAVRGEWDELIIYDRVGENDIVKGKMVSKFVVVATKPELINYRNTIDDKENAQTTYIFDKEIGEKDGIIINKVKEDFSKDTVKYIVYNNLMNGGNDQRLIFDILNEKNMIG